MLQRHDEVGTAQEHQPQFAGIEGFQLLGRDQYAADPALVEKIPLQFSRLDVQGVPIDDFLDF